MLVGIFWNALPYKVGGVSGSTVMDVKPVQSSKAQSLIMVTKLGMVSVPVKPVQPEKA
jgi:hypothetical protein